MRPLRHCGNNNNWTASKAFSTVKPALSGHSKRRQNCFFKTDYRLIQVKSIAEFSKGEHSAILSTFIKLPFAIKTFVLSIFEWPFKTWFTVYPLHHYVPPLARSKPKLA